MENASAQTSKLDLLMTVLGMWFCAGIFTDGWAHNHLASSLETFFTPWHAVLYSGFTVCALALALTAWRSRKPGKTWWKCLPDGYVPSIVGAGIFAFGGGFDLAWHTLFGIEADIEALLSPSHLILAVGAYLIFSGPFRSAWRRNEKPKSFVAALPLIMAMVYMASTVSFMTQFAHLGRHFATGIAPVHSLADHEQARAAAGMLLQMLALTGLALTAVRRWGKSLPLGTFAAVFGLNGIGMSLMVSDGYELLIVPAAFAAGLVADVIVKKYDFASATNRFGWRKLGALIPSTYLLVFFLLLKATDHVWWSIHMWLGTVTVAGLAGLLFSYVAAPPRLPEA